MKLKVPNLQNILADDIQWLRLFCVLSILLMHTALTFTWVPSIFDYWYFQCPNPSVVLTGFCSFVNSACVPLFFCMSGFGARKSIHAGDANYFRRRTFKWFKYLFLAWPLTVFAVLYAHQLVFPEPFDFWSIAFPTQGKEGQVLTLPFHQFHLWYLFAILLFEVILGRCISLISSIKGFHILFLVPLLHAMVIVLQQRGYLLTPVFINAKSIMSFIVYFTWYLSGFVVSGKEKLFNGTLKRHWYIVAIVILIGYFGSKVILLTSEFQNLILLCQFGLGLFDALIPLVVLLIWKALMELKYFDSSRFGNRSKLIRGFILQNALWIYIIQIPIIFWILALFHNCGFWDITSLNKMAHVGLAENIQPFLHWMVLTVITGLIIWVFCKVCQWKNRSI